MNKGNFTAQDNFPQSTYTLDFLQQMSHLAGKLAALGGANYILSGCVVAGNNVSSGLIVINGEILPFDGGSLKSKITIQETKVSDHYAGVNYPEAYLLRKAVFSDAGEYNWADFDQVLTNQQLEARINAITGDVPGITKGWAGFEAKIPKDYMLCDGRALLIADYPELYENIGIIHGGDGLTYFNLPKAGKRFAVGYDATDENYHMGKTGGADKVTLTTQEIPEHNHVNNPLFNKLSAKAGDIDDQSTPGSIDQANAAREYNVGSMTEDRWVQATIQKVGGGQAHENRPPFYVEGKIIKVK